MPQGSAASRPSATVATCDAGLTQALFLCGEQIRLLDLQRKPGKAGGRLVAAAGAGALPDIETEMVMIAARGQERGAVARARRIEAEGFAVKAVGLGEIADAQMHVPDPQAVGRLGIVADLGIGERDEVVDIELVGGHRHRAVAPLPERGIAVGIDLDAVTFGVVEIDGLADAVIGKARQRHAMDRGIDQPARQILARRHQERGVIEPGRVAGFVRGVGPRLEHQQFHAARAEHCACGGALHHGKPEHVAVIVRHGIELADPDRHHADPHRRAVGEGRPAATAALLGTRRRRSGRR